MGSKYNPPSDLMLNEERCLKELAVLERVCDSLKQKGILPKAGDRGRKKDASYGVPVYSGNAALFEVVKKELAPGCEAFRLSGRQVGIVKEGPLAGRSVYADPWGCPYIFRNPAFSECLSYIIYSAGANGFDENGGGDDVVLNKVE